MEICYGDLLSQLIHFAADSSGQPEAVKRGWQKDYFQGHDPGGEHVEGHQTKVNVCPFHSK